MEDTIPNNPRAQRSFERRLPALAAALEQLQQDSGGRIKLSYAFAKWDLAEGLRRERDVYVTGLEESPIKGGLLRSQPQG
jgi:hypothetical protein